MTRDKRKRRLSPAPTPRGVESREGVVGGDPCLGGTRLPVAALVSCRKRGMRDSQIIALWPDTLTQLDLDAVWDWVDETDYELPPDEDEEVCSSEAVRADERHRIMATLSNAGFGEAAVYLDRTIGDGEDACSIPRGCYYVDCDRACGICKEEPAVVCEPCVQFRRQERRAELRDEGVRQERARCAAVCKKIEATMTRVADKLFDQDDRNARFDYAAGAAECAEEILNDDQGRAR